MLWFNLSKIEIKMVGKLCLFRNIFIVKVLRVQNVALVILGNKENINIWFMTLLTYWESHQDQLENMI